MGNKALKGAAWERTFCRLLSEWWSKGLDEQVRDDLFWRTSNSGGRATARGRKGKGTKGHYGDIAATCPEAEPFLKVFCCELKRGYQGATIQDLLDRPARSKPSLYEQWIEKAERDRVASGAMYWMLVVRRDRREPLVFMPEWVMKDLFGNEDDGSSARLTVFVLNTWVCCETLGNWLANVTPQAVKILLISR